MQVGVLAVEIQAKRLEKAMQALSSVCQNPLNWGFCFIRAFFFHWSSMALNNFHPKQGHYLICDFERGFVPPEIVKPRPVIVISKTDSHGPQRNLCTVVAVSTTPPNTVMPWHHRLSFNPNPSQSDMTAWVKCDMIYTVSYARLDKPHTKSNRDGRIYHSIRIPTDDLQAILDCVMRYISRGR